MAKEVLIQANIPASLRDKFKAHCKREGLTLKGGVAQALSQFLLLKAIAKGSNSK